MSVWWQVSSPGSDHEAFLCCFLIIPLPRTETLNMLASTVSFSKHLLVFVLDTFSSDPLQRPSRTHPVCKNLPSGNFLFGFMPSGSLKANRPSTSVRIVVKRGHLTAGHFQGWWWTMLIGLLSSLWFDWSEMCEQWERKNPQGGPKPVKINFFYNPVN